MSIEVMKQALEALRFGLHVGFDESSESQIKKGSKAFDQHNKAITSLRQAIEKAEKQEPAADIERDCNDCKHKNFGLVDGGCGTCHGRINFGHPSTHHHNHRSLGLG